MVFAQLLHTLSHDSYQCYFNEYLLGNQYFTGTAEQLAMFVMLHCRQFLNEAETAVFNGVLTLKRPNVHLLTPGKIYDKERFFGVIRRRHSPLRYGL